MVRVGIPPVPRKDLSVPQRTILLPQPISGPQDNQLCRSRGLPLGRRLITDSEGKGSAAKSSRWALFTKGHRLLSDSPRSSANCHGRAAGAPGPRASVSQFPIAVHRKSQLPPLWPLLSCGLHSTHSVQTVAAIFIVSHYSSDSAEGKLPLSRVLTVRGLLPGEGKVFCQCW